MRFFYRACSLKIGVRIFEQNSHVYKARIFNAADVKFCQKDCGYVYVNTL